jgi:hypothetical protein
MSPRKRQTLSRFIIHKFRSPEILGCFPLLNPSHRRRQDIILGICRRGQNGASSSKGVDVPGTGATATVRNSADAKVAVEVVELRGRKVHRF